MNNVQHVMQQKVTFDLSENKIICITGKNSVGKTTLIRAIKNLTISSTFQETAAPYIFNKNSSITYSFGGSFDEIHFTYNRFIKSIDSKQGIPDQLKNMIDVELPIPHGDRFNHFRHLANIDEAPRAKIAVGEYERPDGLISFLQRVYGGERFKNLKQVNIKKKIYYFILRDEEKRYYIREDYFSSGEYFVVSLHKQILQKKKLIVIDEIDISLDSSAQVYLVEVLREFCGEYKTNIVFTTHSLALMKTLVVGELYYMEREASSKLITVNLRSYNFVKSIMYGFKGKDRYILTEDACLERYIRHLISASGNRIFFEYQIIYIGGATQVIDLMKRNAEDQIFSDSQNTLAVLDGDQQGKSYLRGCDNVILLPFWNIEVEIFRRYEAKDKRVPRVKEVGGDTETKKAKSLSKQLTKNHYDRPPLMSEQQIYTFLNELDPNGVQGFKKKLVDFLKP